MSVVRKNESVACFTEEVDEIAVVSRGDVGETRMGRVNVRGYGGFQQLPQGRTVIGEGLHSSPTPTAAAAAVMMVVMVVLPPVSHVAAPGWMGARDARGGHGAASQDVGQNCCTLNILHQQWDHVC